MALRRESRVTVGWVTHKTELRPPNPTTKFNSMNNTLSQKSLWITVGDNLLAIIKVLCFRKLIGKPAFLFMTWHDTVLDFGLVRERWSPLANYCWTQKCVEGIAWKEAQLDWSWEAISYSLQLYTAVDHRTDSCVTAAHRDTSNLFHNDSSVFRVTIRAANVILRTSAKYRLHMKVLV